MIQHIVIVKTNHTAGSQAEADFLRAARSLAEIPEVQNFECHRQVSVKNSFELGLTMEFASSEDHRIYVDHPIHRQFVEEHWNSEVTDYMEIDLEPYDEA